MEHLPDPTFPSPFAYHSPLAMNGRLSPSSDPFTMDDRCRRHLIVGQTTDPPSVPASSLRAFNRYFGLGGSNSYQRPTNYPLDQYLFGRDGPWVPNVSGVEGPAASGSLASQSFSGCANTSVPSDYGTHPGVAIPPSDSGYESMTRNSIANPSVAGEHDGNSEAISLTLSSAQFQGANRGLGFPAEFPSQPTPPFGLDDAAATTNPTARGIICTHCKLTVKTNSELNKHKARHTKPHRCTEPGCKRKDGFGTQNDLDRHRKSVHGTDGAKYKCPHGSCRGKAKLWPRLDNFRQHLKRVHKLESIGDLDLERCKNQDVRQAQEHDLADLPKDPDDLIRTNSEEQQNRDERSTWAGQYTSQDSILSPDGDRYDNSQHNLPTPGIGPCESDFPCTQPIDLDANAVIPSTQHGTRDSKTNEVSILDEQDALSLDREADGHAFESQRLLTIPSPHGVVQGRDTDINDDWVFEPDIADSNTDSRGVGVEEDCEDPDKPTSLSDSTVKIDLNDEAAASALIRGLEAGGLLEKLMRQHGYQKAKAPPAEQEKIVGAPSSSKNKNPCKSCGKSFARRCELTKHMKRHEKPYRCTFLQCNKAFGSKNDWKRHENSQHFQLDIWRCEEKVKDGADGKCGKCFHRRETFRHHLKKDHDVSALDGEIDAFRLGLNCENRFWCGFCEYNVETKQKGLDAWKERFDHIDDHIAGRRLPQKQMLEWRTPEQEPLEASPCVSRSEDDSGESGLGITGDDAAVISKVNDAVVAPPGPLQPGKRPREDDGPRPESCSKRSKRREIRREFWTCCECKDYQAAEVADCCLACGSHSRCPDCPSETLVKS